MKIVTIVGVLKSGKTSTVTALIEAIRRRGKKAGVCKNVFCPTFTIDSPTSDTMRCRRAGSELTCSRAKGGTAFLYPEALPLSKVLERYKGCDYVLLEGDYSAPVPRIVCAHQADDALPRTNSRTIAYSGCISVKPEIELSLPRFNPLDTEGADALLDLIDAKIPDIMPCSMLDAPLPPVSGVTGDDSQYGRDHRKEQEEKRVQVMIDGETLNLTNEQRELLLSWAKEQNNA